MIESLQNEKVKRYTKLLLKKYRDNEKLFIASGEHLVNEAINKNKIKEIFLLIGEENKYGEVTYVTKEILKKVSGLDSPPKVLAICHKINTEEIKGNIVILDDISDPGNLGTIIRSCAAFNYETIILSPNTVDVYNSKVIRATEGMIFNINIIIKPLEEIIPLLKEKSYFIYGTHVTYGTNPIKEEHKHALIIGSEANGIKDNILDYCDKHIKINMNEKTESLNAAVAASIIMYELSR